MAEYTDKEKKDFQDQADKMFKDLSNKPDKEKDRIDWENKHPKGPL